MNSRDARRLTERTVIADDLDRLLGEAVRERMGMATPPDRVWEQIEHQLRGGPSPVRRRASIRARRTAPLVQALALASLVIVFTLSLGQNLSWNLLLEPYVQEKAVQTPDAGQDRLSSPSAGVSASDVRQASLLARERELEQQMSLGTVPHAGGQHGAQFGEDRTLTKRENLRLSRELASERESSGSDHPPRLASAPPRYREILATFGDAP